MKLRRAISILLAAVLTLFALAACGKDEPSDTTTEGKSDSEKKTGLRLSETDVTLTMGEKGRTLKAYSLSTGKEVITVTWESADKSIVTVDAYGELTAVSEGNTTVSATNISDKTSATCNVTVVAKAEGITLDSSEITVMVAGEYQIHAQMNPPSLESPFTYQSKDPGIAKVDENGKVTGLKSGTTQISVTALNTHYTAICTVRVYDYVTDVRMNESKITMQVGQADREVGYTLTPQNARPTGISWTSSNPDVVSVSEDGKLTARKAGKATVTVTVGNGTEKGVSASMEVEVGAQAVTLTLSENTLTMEINQTHQLTATVSPAATQLKWSSSNPSVATVSGSGEIKALAVGQTVITVQTADGAAKASCTVSVGGQLGLSFEVTNLTLSMGKSQKLVPIFAPEGYTEKLKWESSDLRILNVDADGLVTAKGPGTATVTATGTSSGIKASVTVTVEKSVLDVQITQIKPKSDTFTVHVGEYAKIELEILPEGATEPVTYQIVSGNGYIRVTEDGIFAVKTGYATVVAVSAGGVSSDRFIIQVLPMTDAMKKQATKEYNDQVKAEAKLNTDNLAAIDQKYDSDIKTYQDRLTGTGIADEDDYNTRKADYEAQIKAKQKEFDDAASSGDEQLAGELKVELDQLNQKLEELQNNWSAASLYLDNLKSLQSAKQAEVDAENARHNGVMSELNQKYDYLLPYLEG